METKSKRLSVLSEAEQEALYGLPDFDDGQQLDFLSLSEGELALANTRPDMAAQVYCIVQIGYFKAKQIFFRFGWDDIEDDAAFVLTRYFQGEPFERKAITDHEYYTQRKLIAELFGFRLWSGEFSPQLAHRSAQIVRRDVTPSFVAAELVVWLHERNIVRPAHTTLQDVISEALSAERHRLGDLLERTLDDAGKAALAQLIVHLSLIHI